MKTMQKYLIDNNLKSKFEFDCVASQNPFISFHHHQIIKQIKPHSMQQCSVDTATDSNTHITHLL